MKPDQPQDWLTRQRVAAGSFDLGAMNAVGWLLFLTSVASIGVGIYFLVQPPGRDGGFSGGSLSGKAETKLIAVFCLLVAAALFLGGRLILKTVGVSIYRASRR